MIEFCFPYSFAIALVLLLAIVIEFKIDNRLGVRVGDGKNRFSKGARKGCSHHWLHTAVRQCTKYQLIAKGNYKMIFSHLSHALRLNDICDTIRNHPGTLATLRSIAILSRNGLLHANKVRSPA